MRAAVTGPFWVEQYRKDPQLRAEVRYCAPLGIPHTTFLGWSDDDQAKALAWQTQDDDKCPGCANPLSESTSFDLRTSWQVDTVTCHACKLRASKDGAGEGTFHVVSAKDRHG